MHACLLWMDEREREIMSKRAAIIIIIIITCSGHKLSHAHNHTSIRSNVWKMLHSISHSNTHSLLTTWKRDQNEDTKREETKMHTEYVCLCVHLFILVDLVHQWDCKCSSSIMQTWLILSDSSRARISMYACLYVWNVFNYLTHELNARQFHDVLSKRAFTYTNTLTSTSTSTADSHAYTHARIIQDVDGFECVEKHYHKPSIAMRFLTNFDNFFEYISILNRKWVAKSRQTRFVWGNTMKLELGKCVRRGGNFIDWCWFGPFDNLMEHAHAYMR